MSPTRRHHPEEHGPAEPELEAVVPPQPLDVLVPRDDAATDVPAPDGPPRDRLDEHGHAVHAQITGTASGHVPRHDALAGTDSGEPTQVQPAVPSTGGGGGTPPSASDGDDGDDAREDGDRKAPKTTAFATFIRTLKRFNAAGATDWAAALTYYGLLAIFPGIIALVSVLGLFGDPDRTTQSLVDIVQNLSPGTATDSITGPIESLINQKSAAGVLFVVGLALALWSSSGFVGAFMRASNAIYDVKEGRPIWKLRPLQLLLTFVTVVLLAAVLLGLVLTGPVIDAVAGPLGIGDSAVAVWDIAKWPVMIAAILVVLAVLYYASPNVRLPGFRFFSPGAALTLGVWVVASGLFAFYVSNFGNYDKTYGTLGGAISLLVWFWISNCALLLGVTLNAEVERTRELRAGEAAAIDHLQLPPREVPKDERPDHDEEGPGNAPGDDVPGGVKA